MSEPFAKLKQWVLGAKEAAQRACARSLSVLHVVTKVKQPGYRQGNMRGVPAGKVAWPVLPETHDGVSFIASDCFFAEYDAQDGVVRCLDDADGTYHQGAIPLDVANPLQPVGLPGGKTPNVHIATDPYQSGFGVVIRTAEFGTDGLNKNVFFRLGPVVAHHRDPNQPFNSTLIHDPGMGEDDWAGGLHYPLRVRGFLRKFCQDESGDLSDRDSVTGQPIIDNFVYAPLFNFTRNGDGTVAHGAAHFAGGEAVLSHEAKGFISPADDGVRHLAGVVRYPVPKQKGLKGIAAGIKAILSPPPPVNVYQGGIDLTEALFGSTANGIVYSPVEFVNVQWEPGSKGPFIKRVEFREDMNDFHFNLCGKRVKGRKKWQTWDTIQEYPPTDADDPGGPKTSDPAAAKGDPGGDKYSNPKDPGGTKSGDPGGVKKGQPGNPTTGDPGGGGGGGGGGGVPPIGTPPVGPADEIGPITGGNKGPKDGSRSSASSPAQIEAPSVIGHAQPNLPDGVNNNRKGGTAHDQFWLSRYSCTEIENVKSPNVADTVAAPVYESATANDKASGADRWPTVRSQDAVYTTDTVTNRVLTRDKPAQGPGSLIDVPSNIDGSLAFVENRAAIPSNANAFSRIILAAKNAVGNTINGIFGLGSRLLTAVGVASGWDAQLDFSTSATEPDIVWTPRDAAGAASGTANFKIAGNLRLAQPVALSDVLVITGGNSDSDTTDSVNIAKKPFTARGDGGSSDLVASLTIEQDHVYTLKIEATVKRTDAAGTSQTIEALYNIQAVLGTVTVTKVSGLFGGPLGTEAFAVAATKSASPVTVNLVGVGTETREAWGILTLSGGYET